MLYYLASPYSHPDPKVRLARFRLAAIVAGRMLKAGRLVFSPITHSHPINMEMDDSESSFAFWSELDLAMIDRCQMVVVLMIEGVESSVGVRAEVDYATKKGIPVSRIGVLDEDLRKVGLL